MERALDVVVLEPYCTGSHAAWLDGWRRHGACRIEALTLDGVWWKWRMHGGAVTLARRWNEAVARGRRAPDAFVATDMLDVTTFQALTRSSTAHVPFVLYMHENQLTYPWSPIDRDAARGSDAHYAFINFVSALASDAVWFNSRYHRRVFLEALPGFLARFPDHREPDLVDAIARRSRVVELGVDLARLDGVEPAARPRPDVPLVLWNHRWEYDRDPDTFFDVLIDLAESGVAFELAVLGEAFDTVPPAFAHARRRLAERVVRWGYAESAREYAAWLRAATVLPVTARHEFFGIAVVEAIHCGCAPLLPRRLAYPDRLDPRRFGAFYYDDPADLRARLARWLADPGAIPDTAPLRREMAPLAWPGRAPEFDRELARVVARSHAGRRARRG